MKSKVLILLAFLPFLCMAQRVVAPDDYAWKNVGTPGFGNSYYSFDMEMSTEGVPHIAFTDTEFKASVMKFNGTTWDYVGIQGFSAGDTKFGDIAFTEDNTPYVAYSDLVNDKKVSVQRFLNGNWEYVNTPRISADSGRFVRIETNQNIPYIGYGDYSYGYQIVVKKYDLVYVGSFSSKDHPLFTFIGKKEKEVYLRYFFLC